MKDVYTYPQETWTEAECAKREKSATANFFGDKPPKGIIASSSSTYPQYGQKMRFNGGTIINNELYKSVEVPLPIIPDTYEFFNLISWGTVIRKKLTK